MKITPLAIDGAWLISAPVFNDERGSFREWFKYSEVKAATGLDFSTAQANISTSKKGVLRGIHYSLALEGQAKCVTCVTGSIRDVVVDLRQDSPTFGSHISVELNGGSGDFLLIGAGLGHSFVAREDGTHVAYLVSSEFSPQQEFGINPLDPALGIDWGFENSELILSAKDEAAPTLSECQAEGNLPHKL